MRTWTSCMLRPLAMLILVYITSVAAAQGQTLKERLVGTWKLVSATSLVGGAEEPGPLGPKVTGLLTYSADGYMCANQMGLDRPKFATPDFRGGSEQEKAQAFESFLGYCGRYEVNEEERSVVHSVVTSWYPNWTGTTQKRFVEVMGDRLKLTTPPFLANGKEVTGVIVWERATK